MKPETEAARALQDFADGPALAAADDVAKAFEFAGERIAIALDRAARSGEISFNSLAESVAKDLARIAISDLIFAPLEKAIGSLGQAPQGGGKSSVTVNMNISGAANAGSFTRSQGQISASLARAVAAGQRFI